ncbi:hypothetical protein Plhal304r1_c034g0107331 [Plasmopara halstedii]
MSADKAVQDPALSTHCLGVAAASRCELFRLVLVVSSGARRAVLLRVSKFLQPWHRRVSSCVFETAIF